MSSRVLLFLRGTQLPGRKWQRGRGSFPLEWPSVFQGSQDSLSDDPNEAVWPLSLHSPGPPLGSGPPRRCEGAQVAAALEVQQARLSLQGQRAGPGCAGLQWGHYLWEKRGWGEVK